MRILFNLTILFTSFLLVIPSISAKNSQQKDSTYLTLGGIPLPDGYTRIAAKTNSFADWIRALPLKKPNSPVFNFKGQIFKNISDTTVAAVVDWDIRGKRLEQCMDILIRFYAEYLWENNKQNTLSLPLPANPLSWADWKNGFRPKFLGIHFDLIKSAELDSSKSNFNKYLNMVFAESHTQQFYHSYPRIKKSDVRIGDFIVKKGPKGHAVMIVDLARNANGKLIALIGQGDTPACEFYILNYKKDNPWIPLDFNDKIIPLPIRKKMTWDGLRRFP